MLSCEVSKPIPNLMYCKKGKFFKEWSDKYQGAQSVLSVLLLLRFMAAPSLYVALSPPAGLSLVPFWKFYIHIYNLYKIYININNKYSWITLLTHFALPCAFVWVFLWLTVSALVWCGVQLVLVPAHFFLNLNILQFKWYIFSIPWTNYFNLY